MKKTFKFSNPQLFSWSSYLFCVLFLFTLESCNQSKKEDSKEVAEEHNDAKFDAGKESDAEILVNAAEINLKEIQLGQIAQKYSMNSDVKSLGEMMEKEHSKALNDLQAFAAKKQITLPTSITDDGQEAIKKLSDKKGKEFDNEYCDMMVNGHKDTIAKFEDASADAKDSDIRNWAAAMLPTLRKHLDRSISCKKLCEKM